MADTQVGRLIAILKLDEKQFSKELRTVERQLKQTSRQVSQLGRTVTRSLSVPLAAAGVAAVKLGTDFDKEMTKIITLVGVSEKEVKGLTKSVLALAPAVGKGPGELASALFAVTSAGARGERAMSILEQSAKAAAVGLGETRDVALSVVAAVSAYSSAGLTAAQATDILVNTVREGNLEASELASTLGNVIGVAGPAGVSLDQVGAAVAIITRLGTPVSQAITQVAAAIKQLNAPTTRTIPLIEEAFGSLDNARAQLQNGLLPVFRQLVAQFGDSPEKLRKLLGSSEALNAVLAITAQNADEVDRVFNSLANSTGITDEAFKRTQETASFALDQLVASLSVLGVTLANEVLPKVIVLARETTKLVSQMSAADKATLGWGLALSGIVVALGPLLLGLGALLDVAASVVGITLRFIRFLPEIGTAVLRVVPTFRALIAVLTIVGLLLSAFDASASDGLGSVQTFADSVKRAITRMKLDLDILFGEIEQEAIDFVGRLAKTLVDGLSNLLPEGLISADAGERIQAQFSELTLTIEEEIQRSRAKLAELNTDEGPGFFSGIGEAADQLQEDLATVAGSIAGLVDDTTDGVSNLTSNVSAATKGVADILKDFGEQAAVAHKQAALLGESFDEQSALASLLEGTIAELLGVLDEGDPIVQALATRFNILTDEIKKSDAAAAAATEVDRLLSAAQDEYDKLNETLLTVPERIAAATAEFELQAIASGKSADEVARLVDEYSRLQTDIQNVRAAKEAAQETERIFDELSRGVQRSLADAIEEGFNLDTVEDFAKNALNILKRVLAEQAAATITKAISGALNAGLNGTTGGTFTSGGLGSSGAGSLSAVGNLGAGGGGFFNTTLGNLFTPTSQQYGVTGGQIGPAQQQTGISGTTVGGALAGLGSLVSSILTSIDDYNASSRTRIPRTGVNAADYDFATLDTAKLIGSIGGAVIGTIIGLFFGGATSGVLAQVGKIAGGFLAEDTFNLVTNRQAGDVSDADLARFIVLSIFAPTIGLLTGHYTGLFDQQRAKAVIRTSPVDDGGFEGGITREGPFGFVGLAVESKNLNNEFRSSLTDIVVGFDQAIADHLNPEEIAQIADFLPNRFALKVTFTQFDNELQQILADRMRGIVDALGGDVGRFFGDLPSGEYVTTGIFPKFQERFAEFLSGRRELEQLRDDLFGIATQAKTQAEQQLDEINAAFGILAQEAPDFGVDITGIEEHRLNAIDLLTDNFNDKVLQAIHEFERPFDSVIQELVDVQAERLREAEFLGADLVEVERLTALERMDILEQINDPIHQVLDALDRDLGGTSILQQLDDAETVFDDLLAQVLDGALHLRPELAQAGADLARIAEEAFGTGGPFGAIIESIKTGLQTVLDQEVLFPDSTFEQQSQQQASGPPASAEPDQFEQFIQDLRDDGQLQSEAQIEALQQVVEGLEGLGKLQTQANRLLDSLVNGS